MKSLFRNRRQWLPAAAMLTASAWLHADSTTVSSVLQGRDHEVLFAIQAEPDGLVAVGSGGQLARSADGGQWRRQTLIDDGRALFSIATLPGNTLAVGQQGLILRAVAGDWSQVPVPTQERLFAVAQHTSGLAVTCGSFGTVLVSGDGGGTWTKLSIDWMALIDQPYEPHVYDVAIDAAGRIFMVGEFGMLARSDDRGASWTLLHAGDASLFSLEISDTGLGYAVGQSGALVRSGDGGNTWQELPSGSEAILLDVAIRGNGDAIVTGIRQTLFVPASGQGIAALEGNSLDSSWYSDIAVLGDAFYLVGEKGRVIRISM